MEKNVLMRKAIQLVTLHINILIKPQNAQKWDCLINVSFFSFSKLLPKSEIHTLFFWHFILCQKFPTLLACVYIISPIGGSIHDSSAQNITDCYVRRRGSSPRPEGTASSRCGTASMDHKFAAAAVWGNLEEQQKKKKKFGKWLSCWGIISWDHTPSKLDGRTGLSSGFSLKISSDHYGEWKGTRRDAQSGRYCPLTEEGGRAMNAESDLLKLGWPLGYSSCGKRKKCMSK